MIIPYWHERITKGGIPLLLAAERLALQRFAEEIRVNIMRTIAFYGEGHVGGSLSLADLLAALYGREMRFDPADPKNPDRDKLVLSKGHCGPALYAALALMGFFPAEELKTINRFGTRLPSHCDMNRTPGIDMSTGSLGQGASTAAGIALADKVRGRTSHTYLILGDGECNEGQVWEMAMFAAHHKLSRLIAFVDRNRQQLDGLTDDILRMGDLAELFRANGWNAVTIDGHNFEAITGAIENAKASSGAPSMIILETVKGKGWAEAERRVPSHYMTVSKQQLEAYEAVSAERIREIDEALSGKAGERA
jgi:transketolase